MNTDPTGLLAALALIPGFGAYLVYAPILIAACKIVTVVCPPPVAGSRWLGAYKLVSAVALNFGYAANAVPPGLPATVAGRVEAATAVTAAVPAAAAVQSKLAQVKSSGFGDGDFDEEAAEVLAAEVKS